MIELAGARGIDMASGEALEVQVADRGGFAAVVGAYKVTFKVNPELQVTFHVTDDAAEPGGAAGGGTTGAASVADEGGAPTLKADRTRAASAKSGSPTTGDPMRVVMLGLGTIAILAALAAALARRLAEEPAPTAPARHGRGPRRKRGAHTRKR